MDRLIVSVSGVRGTIGGSLSPQTACDFGCAFGTHVGAGKTIVLGRDSRPSGPMIRRAVAAGLQAVGVNVVDLGLLSTPGVGLMTRTLEAAGGVMITASHNPPAYNGIKFLQPHGPSLTAGQAEGLKRLWSDRAWSTVQTDRLGEMRSDQSTHERHRDAVLAITDVQAVRARGFRVVVDSINGAGCTVTPMLLEALGCDVVHLNGTPDGRFAHEPEPVEKNLGDLCKAVAEHDAAAGFAQDPDADRLVVVDETGRFIGEEYTLALCAAFVLRHRRGTLAANLATSRMIDDIAAEAGAEVVRAPTGEANVVEAMQREGCIFGGEGNGGVIDPRVVEVRDSLVGMAMLLQYLAETGKPLSELSGAIPRYALVKTKQPCPAGAIGRIIERTKVELGGETPVRFNEDDGLRADFADAWVSVRASNTEPIMRIFAEAPQRRRAEALVEQVKSIADGVIGQE